jgi:hypothetical protein
VAAVFCRDFIRNPLKLGAAIKNGSQPENEEGERMNSVTQIPYRIDQAELFERMRISKKNQLYGKAVQTYQDICASLPELLKVQGTFVLRANDEAEKLHPRLAKVSHIVYCMVTLGAGISERSTACFGEKDFFKGLMIDSMADILVFNASNDFYALIKEAVYQKMGYALTMRYSPDDELIPLSFQQNILEQVNGRSLLAVGITEAQMYNPVKTMGYLYGADKDIELASADHDCQVCSNDRCEFRKQKYQQV